MPSSVYELEILGQIIMDNAYKTQENYANIKNRKSLALNVIDEVGLNIV